MLLCHRTYHFTFKISGHIHSKNIRCNKNYYYNYVCIKSEIFIENEAVQYILKMNNKFQKKGINVTREIEKELKNFRMKQTSKKMSFLYKF